MEKYYLVFCAIKKIQILEIKIMTVVVFESVVDYLEKCGLIKTARVMRKELKTVREVVLDGDKELNLLSKLPSDFKSPNFLQR